MRDGHSEGDVERLEELNPYVRFTFSFTPPLPYPIKYSWKEGRNQHCYDAEELDQQSHARPRDGFLLKKFARGTPPNITSITGRGREGSR